MWCTTPAEGSAHSAEERPAVLTVVWPPGYVLLERIPTELFKGVPYHKVTKVATSRITGGWLGLTRQGLSPCKKRQASLGALTAVHQPRGARRLHAHVSPLTPLWKTSSHYHFESTASR